MEAGVKQVEEGVSRYVTILEGLRQKNFRLKFQVVEVLVRLCKTKKERQPHDITHATATDHVPFWYLVTAWTTRLWY